jgi:hypothetical protein
MRFDRGVGWMGWGGLAWLGVGLVVCEQGCNDRLALFGSERKQWAFFVFFLPSLDVLEFVPRRCIQLNRIISLILYERSESRAATCSSV